MDTSINNKRKKGKRSAARWPFFLIGISVLLLLVGGIQLFRYYRSYRDETALNDRLQQIRADIADGGEENASGTGETSGAAGSVQDADTASEVGLTPLEQSAALQEAMVGINPEYVGWLELQDTSVSYPVVWRDNEYYINHDFEGKSNSHGAIFLDETCNEESLIWLIHGHHMKDGTMFAGLAEYKNKDYLKAHTSLTFDAGEGVEHYQIYAAALIDFTNETELTPAFHYEKLPGTEEAFSQWQNNLRKNAYWYDKDAAPESTEMTEGLLPEVLVLSTCEYGTDVQRLIIVAVNTADRG